MTQSFFTPPFRYAAPAAQWPHRNRRPSEFINWHFTGDGARHGLKIVRPANAKGTSWFWNYTRKRWDIYVLGGIDANLVVATVR